MLAGLRCNDASMKNVGIGKLFSVMNNGGRGLFWAIVIIVKSVTRRNKIIVKKNAKD